jgi:hypothetical protein
MTTALLMPSERPTRAPAAEAAASGLTEAARRYFVDYGWHTRIVGPLLLLALRHEVVGVAMGTALSEAVAEQLRERGLVYPVVPGLGARAVSVFIARSGPCDYRLRSHFLATVLRNTRIALPPSKIEGKPLEWIVAPESCQDGIPELGPLMRVIRDRDSSPTRGWRPNAWRR